MTTTYPVGMAQRGQVTLPKPLRDEYHLEDGQQMSVIDLGGMFLMVPKQTNIDDVCNRLRDGLLASGATLEDMLADLRAETAHR